MLAVTFLGIASNQTTSCVQAARWHKGTPKVIRGKYKTHKYGADLMATFTIRKNTVRYWAAGMPVLNGVHVKYRKLGKNKYQLKYDNKPSLPMYRGEKNVKQTFRKVGKRYKLTTDSHWFYKY